MMIMKKGLLAFLAVASTVSMAKDLKSVAAFKEAVKNQDFAAPKKRILAPQCSHFSGSWQGFCVDEHGKSEADSVRIVQENCSSIEIDGIPHPIEGSILLQNNPSPDANDLSYTGIIAHSWNDAQTKLYRLTTVALFNGAMASADKSSMWLSGDELRIKNDRSTDVLYIGSADPDWKTILNDCTYQKVP